MKRLLSILLLTSLSLQASIDPRYSYTFIIDQRSLAMSITTVAAYCIFTAFIKPGKKNKKYYCLKCICDLETFDLVDHTKIVSADECYICGRHTSMIKVDK